jgi:methyl-accepting chemotaxis protein
MSASVMDRMADHISESAHQASRATSAITDAIEDGVGVVRNAAKQGGDAAEEFLNHTTQRLQRHLALTVATTFAIGVTAGAFIGWIMKRR